MFKKSMLYSEALDVLLSKVGSIQRAIQLATDCGQQTLWEQFGSHINCQPLQRTRATTGITRISFSALKSAALPLESCFESSTIKQMSQDRLGREHALPGIAASVKFDAHAQGSQAKATAAHHIHLALKPKYEKRGGYFFHPNVSNKSVCADQKAGRRCYGACGNFKQRPTAASCWTLSFRWHLIQLCGWGCMLQVMEPDGVLGDRQKEEAEMARRLHLPIWKCTFDEESYSFDFEPIMA